MVNNVRRPPILRRKLTWNTVALSPANLPEAKMNEKIAVEVATQAIASAL